MSKDNQGVKTRLLRILNLAAFVVMVVVNALANALPIAGRTTGEVSNMYPDLFAPAPITFGIWGLIYLLLGAFVVFGFISKPRESSSSPTYLDKIGYLFALSCAVNAAWIFAWHSLQVGVSLVLMVVLFVLLARIYLALHAHADYQTNTERLAVQLPFRVYFGWISVALIANVAAVLVDAGWTGFGISEVLWTQIMVVAAVLVGLLVLMIRKDYPYALVVVWALVGIGLRHYSAEPQIMAIVSTAIAGIAVLLVGAAKQMFSGVRS